MKKTNLAELVNSYENLSTALHNSLNSDFEVQDGYLYIVETFIDNPIHGNSIIVRHSPSNNLYLVPFVEVEEGNVQLSATANWKQVKQEYVVIDSTPSYGNAGASESFQELAEVSIDENEKGKPLILKMRIIKQGFGNTNHNHYYSDTLLQKEASKFVGVKMYVTEHRKNETNVRNEVAEILESEYDASVSGIVARIGVFDEAFATNIRNRDALGILPGLQCSITAQGTVYTQEITKGDRTGRMVKEFTRVNTVDFVAAAGAGGQAISIE